MSETFGDKWVVLRTLETVFGGFGFSECRITLSDFDFPRGRVWGKIRSIIYDFYRIFPFSVLIVVVRDLEISLILKYR